MTRTIRILAILFLALGMVGTRFATPTLASSSAPGGGGGGGGGSSTPTSQTITFNPLPNKTYGDSPFDIGSYASASSGLTVSFSSATTGVCTVSGSTVTIVSVGTCTIDANQAGDATYAAASQVQQSFTVAARTVTDCPTTEAALQTDITNAGPGGTVAFVCSTPTTTVFQDTGLGRGMLISQNVTLDASGAPGMTFNGEGVTEFFHVNPGVTLGLTGLTLLYGRSDYAGAILNSGTVVVRNTIFSSNHGPGAIYNYMGTVIVTGSTFSKNFSASNGAAIYNDSGTVTVTNSTFSGNQAYAVGPNGPVATNGGAIFNSGSMTLTNSTLSGNSAAQGGAIYNSSGTASVTNSTLSGNSGSGGAIGNDTGTVTVTNSTLSGNSGTYGGAIHNNTGIITVTSSTLSGNSANYGQGGAIFSAGTASITNSTLSANSAFRGGAILNSGTMTVTHSTLSGNSAGGPQDGGSIQDYGSVTLGSNIIAGGDCVPDGPITDIGYNLATDGTCLYGGTGDILSSSPGLDPNGLQGNGGLTQTIALQPASPAIDQIPTSNATLCPTSGTDQRGVGYPRPDNGESFCDIGAYEYQGVDSVTKQSQAITFGTLADKTYGDAPFTVSATASSTLAVSFSSATASVCTVSGSTVTIVTAGTCTIDANQAGDSTYAAASQVQQSFTVAQASQIISFGPLSGQLSNAIPFTVSATGGASGNPVTFAAGPSTACIASGTNGSTITIIGVGTCTVTASQAGNGNYLAAPDVAQSFQVTAPQQSTGLSVATASGTYGGSADLSATLTAATIPVSGETVVFSLNGTAVCGSPTSISCPTTDTGGLAKLSGISLSGINAGTYPNGVSASFAGDGAYTASNGSNTLTVDPAAVTFTLSDLNQTYTGSAKSVTVVSSPAGVTSSVKYTGTNGTTYTTSTTAPANAGSYTVDVTSADTNYAGSQTATLVIAKADQTITVFTAAPTTQVYNGTFTVAASSSSGLTVSYGSSGGCTNSGADYTMTSGTTACTVTFGQSGDGNYNAAQQVTETVTATKAAATIALSNLNQTYDGSAEYATATTTPSGLDGITISYMQNGNAVSAPINAGSYAVDASLSSPNYTASDATGTLVIAKAPQTISFDLSTLPSKTYGDGAFDISSYASGGGSSNAITFSSGTTSVCTVSGSTVSIVSAGTCTINADQAGNGNYVTAITVSQSVTISKATLTVTAPSTRSVQYSDALPSLTPAITGYVLKEDQSVLTSTPTCTTGAATASFSSQTGTATTGVSSAPGSYAITCSGGSATNYTFNDVAGSLTVTPEDATIQYSGTQTTAALLTTGLTSIPLTATIVDSAAKGYNGSNAESASSGSIGKITNASVEFDVYPAGSCLSGTPTVIPAQVASTGTPGVATATASFSQSTEGSYCVVARVTAGYYTAPAAQVAGIAFYTNTGQFATGGGWIADSTSSTGQATLSFNARYTKKGGAKGQMMYSWQALDNGQLANYTITSNAISTLTFSGTTSPITATLQGKCAESIVSVATGQQLYSQGNLTFIASATDGDYGQPQNVPSDTFSLSVFDSSNTVIKQVTSMPLAGGNLVVHNG